MATIYSGNFTSTGTIGLLMGIASANGPSGGIFNCNTAQISNLFNVSGTYNIKGLQISNLSVGSPTFNIVSSGGGSTGGIDLARLIGLPAFIKL